jgi:glutamate--cysteine ligase
MRGADAGPRDHLVALPAFWVGLLYDQSALDAAWDLVKHWSAEERQALRDAVPREGLAARIGGRSVQEIARETLRIARGGLAARGISDRLGRDETRFLDPLEQIVETGQTRAQQLLGLFHGRWGGSVEPAYEECSF